MKLDDLHDTPVLAALVRESAIGSAGALELLSDDYQPPKQLTLITSPVEGDQGEGEAVESEGDDADDSEDEDEDEGLVPYDGEHGYPEGEEPTDAEGYPEIVNIPRVAAPVPATPPRGVRLIRPRRLSDMHSA